MEDPWREGSWINPLLTDQAGDLRVPGALLYMWPTDVIAAMDEDGIVNFTKLKWTPLRRFLLSWLLLIPALILIIMPPPFPDVGWSKLSDKDGGSITPLGFMFLGFLAVCLFFTWQQYQAASELAKSDVPKEAVDMYIRQMEPFIGTGQRCSGKMPSVQEWVRSQRLQARPEGVPAKRGEAQPSAAGASAKSAKKSEEDEEARPAARAQPEAAPLVAASSAAAPEKPEAAVAEQPVQASAPATDAKPEARPSPASTSAKAEHLSRRTFSRRTFEVLITAQAHLQLLPKPSRSPSHRSAAEGFSSSELLHRHAGMCFQLDLLLFCGP